MRCRRRGVRDRVGISHAEHVILRTSHPQLNTVMNADKIVVLSDGVVAESGSHDELLKLNGIYSEMWDMQQGRDDDANDDDDDDDESKG